MTTSEGTKPTANDDAIIAKLVDATREIKAKLVAHRAAMRSGDRLALAEVEAVFVDVARQTAAALDGCLVGRRDAISTPGADRERIVRDAVEFATRPLRKLLQSWGRDA